MSGDASRRRSSILSFARKERRIQYDKSLQTYVCSVHGIIGPGQQYKHIKFSDVDIYVKALDELELIP